MKKLSILGLVVLFGTSVAVASSLAVPWFVDSTKTRLGIPQSENGVTEIITLHNNTSEVMVCSIEYFNAGGDSMGPDAPNNTFTIAPNSSLAFRPVADDPGPAIDPANTGGQEGPQGVAVPNRPMPDGKNNGACVVRWVGGPGDVQGMIAHYQMKNGISMSYAHLLPAGV